MDPLVDPTKPVDEAAERAAALETLREALNGFYRAQRRLRGRDARVEGGVSFAHYPLLGALVEQGDLSAGQLANEAGLTPATVTQMVDTLSAAGLVERNRSDLDRRVVTIQLTEEGRRRHARKQVELLTKWRESLSDFSPEELEAASAVVARICVYLDDL